ncbi:MAG TPA: SRPBCC domain-containing protein [Blastocatellia bacterium]
MREMAMRIGGSTELRLRPFGHGVAAMAAVGILLGLAASALAQDSQSFQVGAVKVTKIYKPEKTLQLEVEVPASPEAVWEAFSTADGLKTWLGPEAEVEMRPGGNWLVKFPGASTGGGNVLEFVEGKSITIAAMAPDSFPTVRRERTRAVFDFEASPDGKSTIVRLTQTGWKAGEEWDKAFEYLAKGNPMLLAMLRQRFTSGPIDWAAMMK